MKQGAGSLKHFYRRQTYSTNACTCSFRFEDSNTHAILIAVFTLHCRLDYSSFCLKCTRPIGNTETVCLESDGAGLAVCLLAMTAHCRWFVLTVSAVVAEFEATRGKISLMLQSGIVGAFRYPIFKRWISVVDNMGIENIAGLSGRTKAGTQHAGSQLELICQKMREVMNVQISWYSKTSPTDHIYRSTTSCGQSLHFGLKWSPITIFYLRKSIKSTI